LELILDKEQQEKLDAIKSARTAKAAARNAAANEAHIKHLFEHAQGDEMQLIVFSMPAAFGGKAIYKVPTDEYWDVIQKKNLDAIIKDKKGTQGGVAAMIAENHKLLLYPDPSTLQEWRKEVPGLYVQIKDAFEERCDHGKAVTGK
jgi:hypothetical protein